MADLNTSFVNFLNHAVQKWADSNTVSVDRFTIPSGNAHVTTSMRWRWNGNHLIHEFLNDNSRAE